MEGIGSNLVEGGTYDLRIDARNPKGEGIGKINDVVVFVRNTKTRAGKIYTVKITKLYRTFAYAEAMQENSKYFIGNGSLIV
jgi:predicted RNA-binding protein with TRAM domain